MDAQTTQRLLQGEASVTDNPPRIPCINTENVDRKVRKVTALCDRVCSEATDADERKEARVELKLALNEAFHYLPREVVDRLDTSDEEKDWLNNLRRLIFDLDLACAQGALLEWWRGNRESLVIFEGGYGQDSNYRMLQPIGNDREETHGSAREDQVLGTFEAEQLLSKYKPCEQKAYLSWKVAEGRNPPDLKDKAAYEWLREADDEHFSAELAGYRLPSMDSWIRYVREVRKGLGESKHRSRKDRPHGPSIVRQEDI